MMGKFECPVCGHIRDCSLILDAMPKRDIETNGPLRSWCYGPGVVEIWTGSENLDRLKYYKETSENNVCYHPLFEMKEI